VEFLKPELIRYHHQTPILDLPDRHEIGVKSVYAAMSILAIASVSPKVVKFSKTKSPLVPET